jgi:cytochrome c553/uncharacterized protein (DUF302 family)
MGPFNSRENVYPMERIMKKILTAVALLGLAFSASAADMANGERINKSCAVCHGVYGQGAPGQLSPRIAGLPREYIQKALRDYLAGHRNYPLMIRTSGIDKMSENDIEDIAAYLSSLDLSADGRFNITSVGGSPQAGAAIYNKECRNCHAPDGYGRPAREAPPLAGQHSVYLFTAMKTFQQRARVHANDPEDETFAAFNDNQLIDIIAHLATLDDRKIVRGYQFMPPVFARVDRVEPKPAPESAHGIEITDIKQTVVRMALASGVSIDDSIDAMMSKATDLNLKLVGQQRVSEELEARGVDSPYLSIFQFCNPMDAKVMVIADPVFSSYMPCRISMVADGSGKIWLMMLNLDMLINSKLLPNDVIETAVKVNTQMLEIMMAGASGQF